nr:tetratricopeptide repeat protein [Deltaproteobacteria bacterium]
RSGTSLATAPRESSALATGTPATSVAGTPAYMAPELLRGHVATAASDQFGFGVTAYEVLAGRRPFTGTTWAELASAIDRDPPARLAAVPGWLDAAIRRCLAVDPARRLASMTEVADLLEERARGRRPTLWIAAAATTAVLASGATWLAIHEPAARSCDLGADQIASVWNDAARQRVGLDAPVAASIARWTAAWITARDTVCRAGEYEPPAVIAARERCLDGRRAELAALLDRVAASPRAAERLGDALATLPPSECTSLAPGAADPLPLDPARAAAVHDIARELPAVRAAIALGDARPVAPMIAQLVERARASGHAPTLADTLLLHAEAARATADLATAALSARDAVAAAERGHDDLGAARAWIARMTIAGDRRDLAATDDLAAIAEAAIDRAGAPPHLVAQLLRIRGLVAYNRGQLALAHALLGEARTAYAELAGERSIEVAAVLSSLGTVERATGDLDAAERHHRLALALDRELRGDRHPDVARDLHNLAGVARLRGELDAAVMLYREALALEDALRGPTSVESALTHNSLGLVHMARRDWAAAETELALARHALRAAGHGDLAFAEHNAGLVMAARGRHAEALVHFDSAGAAYAATIGDAAAAPIRLHLDRARSELGVGRTALARAHATQARDAATRADLGWIVDEAIVFLAEPRARPRTPAPAPLPVVIEPAPAVMPPPPTPQPATESPVPPPPAAPQPKRDVGVYGSSQGW